MKEKFDKVYQFKISLRGIRPPIWRRIQVPSIYTFWDLHVAIQDVMEWEDMHLHEFRIAHPVTREKVRIGIPNKDAEYWGIKIIPEREERIAEWFSMENREAEYIYDFGDNWVHKILLEKIIARERNVGYPRCISGKRASPPEDCGGVEGYYELLEALKDPNHEMHEEIIEWVGKDFDPEYFNPKEIVFRDPEKYWKNVKKYYMQE